MEIRERIKKVFARIDDLTLRERAVVFGALMTVLFLGWYAYLMEPLAKEERALVSELEAKRRQFQDLNDQFVLMTQKQGTGQDAANRRHLAELRAEEARVKEELNIATTHLVKSEAMPDLLRQVLNKSQGLELVKLNGLGSVPLVPPAPAAKGEAKVEEPAVEGPKTDGELASAYKHGMEVQFTGDFFSTLNYLRKLEQLEWGFFWDSVDFSVSDYPRSVASIRVFTLSLNPDWIGT